MDQDTGERQVRTKKGYRMVRAPPLPKESKSSTAKLSRKSRRDAGSGLMGINISLSDKRGKEGVL